MRSLQSKFLALTVGCVLLSALALGYVGFLYTHKLVNEDSAQFMNLFCEDKAEEINATLTSIEQSVNMIQDYTIEQYSELGKNGMDKDNTDVLVKKVQEVALHTVKNTEGSRGKISRNSSHCIFLSAERFDFIAERIDLLPVFFKHLDLFNAECQDDRRTERLR